MRVLHAVCAGCSQTCLCMAGKVRKKPSHTQVHTRACVCRNMQVSTIPIRAQCGHRIPHSSELKTLSAVHCKPLSAPNTRGYPPPAPWLRLCPFLGELTECSSECEIPLHRTACSKGAGAQQTCSGMAVSFVHHEDGRLPNSSAPTASIKCVNHFLAIQAPEKS